MRGFWSIWCACAAVGMLAVGYQLGYLQAFRDEIAATVEDAIDCGATRVRVDGFVYQLDPAFRRVITVLPKGRRANISQREVR